MLPLDIGLIGIICFHPSDDSESYLQEPSAGQYTTAIVPPASPTADFCLSLLCGGVKLTEKPTSSDHLVISGQLCHVEINNHKKYLKKLAFHVNVEFSDLEPCEPALDFRPTPSLTGPMAKPSGFSLDL